MFAVNKEDPYLWEPESYDCGLVIRYWGCQLRCPLCFAQSYAYRNEQKSRIPKEASLEEAVELAKKLIEIKKLKAKWFRIEGGEPIQSRKHMEMTAELAARVLKLLEPRGRVVIQTNGIWLGKKEENVNNFIQILKKEINREDIKAGKRIAIEISFKGPNPESARAYSGIQEIDILNLQTNAFQSLVKILEKEFWKNGNEVVSVYPVAGFGPDLEKFVFIPLDAKNKLFPLFHPSTWSPNYRENVVEKFKEIMTKYPKVYDQYSSVHGKKLPLYGLEIRPWQRAWVSRIGKDQDLEKFFLDHMRVNLSSQKNILYHMNNYLSNVTATEDLLKRTREMLDFYACAKPRNHYPYL
uniref:4Fe-4S cluster-binding domain-containing protein n=1 Tax=Archaeoglobus fulgidus TaxID=2234 RepID=A0A7C3MGH8_ARCFL